MDSNKLLDAVCRKHRIDSKRALARFLDIDRTRINAYRAGRRKLDYEACRAVADALNLPIGYVLCVVQAERAKRTDARRDWLRLARHMKTAAGALVLGSALLGTQPVPSAQVADARELYILLNRRQNAGRGFRRRSDRSRRTAKTDERAPLAVA